MSKFRHNKGLSFSARVDIDDVDIVLHGYEKAHFLNCLRNYTLPPMRADRSDEPIMINNREWRWFQQENLIHWLQFWPDDKINKALACFIRKKMIVLAQLMGKNAEQKTIIYFNREKDNKLRADYIRQVGYHKSM